MTIRQFWCEIFYIHICQNILLPLLKQISTSLANIGILVHAWEFQWISAAYSTMHREFFYANLKRSEKYLSLYFLCNPNTFCSEFDSRRNRFSPLFEQNINCFYHCFIRDKSVLKFELWSCKHFCWCDIFVFKAVVLWWYYVIKQPPTVDSWQVTQME